MTRRLILNLPFLAPLAKLLGAKQKAVALPIQPSADDVRRMLAADYARHERVQRALGALAQRARDGGNGFRGVLLVPNAKVAELRAERLLELLPDAQYTRSDCKVALRSGARIWITPSCLLDSCRGMEFTYGVLEQDGRAPIDPLPVIVTLRLPGLITV